MTELMNPTSFILYNNNKTKREEVDVDYKALM